MTFNLLKSLIWMATYLIFSFPFLIPISYSLHNCQSVPSKTGARLLHCPTLNLPTASYHTCIRKHGSRSAWYGPGAHPGSVACGPSQLLIGGHYLVCLLAPWHGPNSSSTNTKFCLFCTTHVSAVHVCFYLVGEQGGWCQHNTKSPWICMWCDFPGTGSRTAEEPSGQQGRKLCPALRWRRDRKPV